MEKIEKKKIKDKIEENLKSLQSNLKENFKKFATSGKEIE